MTPWRNGSFMHSNHEYVACFPRAPSWICSESSTTTMSRIFSKSTMSLILCCIHTTTSGSAFYGYAVYSVHGDRGRFVGGVRYIVQTMWERDWVEIVVILHFGRRVCLLEKGFVWKFSIVRYAIRTVAKKKTSKSCNLSSFFLEFV